MKIAIVKLSALGDIIHAMVVLQFIKKINKEILIDWIVEERYKDLLEFHPDINKVHFISLKKAKKKKSILVLIREFKKVNKLPPYDLVIDMQGLLKSAIIARIIPSKIILGFDSSSLREHLASIFYNKTFNYDYAENIVERNFELIKFALKLPINKEDINHKLPFLFVYKHYEASILSKTKKNVILIPGASHISKRYPPEKFSKLVNLLDANYLVIWGDLEEKLIAEKIKSLSPDVSICNRMTLSSLVSLVSQVDLVIGPDTGPTHIAWALNIPSITLFGSTPGHRNTYVTKINKIIESNSIVNTYKIDKKDYSIRDIDEQEISHIAKSILP